mgnify:CR=1 FL=1
MRFITKDDYEAFRKKQIYEYNTIRTTFAWFPVYLEDTKEYVWLEKVSYRRVADHHWRFHKEYFSVSK